VGLVIIDLEMNIKVWNGFMENHSGLLAHDVTNKKLYELFDEISEQWLKQKINTVCLLKNKTFTTWQQRPYLLKFKSYRPITGSATYMYQNITFLPLSDLTGNITQICLTIYDVTDVATSKLLIQESQKLDK
jgi:PAS domain-containing protein